MSGTTEKKPKKKLSMEEFLIGEIHDNEKQLDQLVKDMYQNRLDKRALINKLYETQNPNLDELTQTQKKNENSK